MSQYEGRQKMSKKTKGDIWFVIVVITIAIALALAVNYRVKRDAREAREVDKISFDNGAEWATDTNATLKDCDRRILNEEVMKVLKVDKKEWLLGCYSEAKKN